MSIKAIVTDIEGTTSSISFVKEVLFPYAHKHMAEFVQEHQGDKTVSKQLDEVRRIVGKSLSVDEVVAQLLRWIEEDKKITPLKTLQGMIWEAGYKDGAYKGHMYEDAVRNLRKWHEQGLKLYVFSSGSLHAQKLLFGHTEYGDLNSLFSGYFDTNIGAKADPVAYETISATLHMPPGDIMFLSDVRAELDAARNAGMRTTWLVRGETPKSAEHKQVSDFDAINI